MSRFFSALCNSYTMGCLPVCGDNPRALAIYTTYISVDLAHREIFRAKVGKGGINSLYPLQNFGLVGSETQTRLHTSTGYPEPSLITFVISTSPHGFIMLGSSDSKK